MSADDKTVVIERAVPAPARKPRVYRADPRRRRRLSVEWEPRAGGLVGGYAAEDTWTWCPVPFVAVRWRGSPRTAGLALGVPAVLSVLADLPAPWSVLLVLWLAVPAGGAFWHAWLHGRLW
jgi:hypothetical protein